jgi:hypothetical protein
MAQIAVTILDPSNRRSAHLVETQLAVKALIPPIVAQLKMPQQAGYNLFLPGQENALPPEQTLAQLGVPAGAELVLRPVRNALLRAILAKLYDEARNYVEEQAWESAKAKLEELRRLDPAYADPDGLAETIRQRASPHYASSQRAAPQSTAPLPQNPRPQIQGEPRNTLTAPNRARPVATSPALPATSGGDAYRLSPQTASQAAKGASCLGILLMVVGVIVAGAILFVGGNTYFPGLVGDLAARIGIPGFNSPLLGTGDVQVTLRWQGDADLDLHVVDPNGEKIWFANKESSSGGILDVDANGACEGLPRPVENVYWPTGEAPNGSYAVSVVYYQSCGENAPTDYEVTITLDGEVVDVIRAQMSLEGEEHPVTVFEY